MIDLPKALAIIFAGLVLLKVTGLTELSWLIVMFPITLPLALVLLGCVGFAALIGLSAIGDVVSRRRDRRERLELLRKRYPL